MDAQTARGSLGLEKAAKEMLKRKKQVSMNTIAVEVLTKAMKADKKRKEVVRQ